MNITIDIVESDEHRGRYHYAINGWLLNETPMNLTECIKDARRCVQFRPDDELTRLKINKKKIDQENLEHWQIELVEVVVNNYVEGYDVILNGEVINLTKEYGRPKGVSFIFQNVLQEIIKERQEKKEEKDRRPKQKAAGKRS